MFRTLPGGGQVAPIFPIDIWNHHHDVLQGIPRTTNAKNQLSVPGSFFNQFVADISKHESSFNT